MHTGLALANAGGLVGALAAIDDADAADCNRGLVLLVAEGWDGDAIQAGSVEDGRSVGNGHGVAVDGAGEGGRIGG